MISKMQVYEYNGTQIEFEIMNGHIMANANTMFNAGNARLDHWKASEVAKRYIEAVSRKLGIGENELIIVKRGGTNRGGTWIHEKLILNAARYISVDFELWCDEKISELMKNSDVKESPVMALESHTKRPIQITNAKSANAFSFSKGGKEECIEWNRTLSIRLTGKTPSELKEYAKSKNVPSKFRTSGKEVIRYYRPDKAACVSIADYLHSNGVNDNEAIDLAEVSIPVVNKLLEIQKNRALAS